jgi:hypothetical protein
MTIQNRELWRQRENVKTTSDNAAPGTYESAALMDLAVDEAIQGVMNTFRRWGFAARGDDRCLDLEAAIYGFLKESNPDYANEFTLNEAFGERFGEKESR